MIDKLHMGYAYSDLAVFNSIIADALGISIDDLKVLSRKYTTFVGSTTMYALYVALERLLNLKTLY